MGGVCGGGLSSYTVDDVGIVSEDVFVEDMLGREGFMVGSCGKRVSVSDWEAKWPRTLGRHRFAVVVVGTSRRELSGGVCPLDDDRT